MNRRPRLPSSRRRTRLRAAGAVLATTAAVLATLVVAGSWGNAAAPTSAGATTSKSSSTSSAPGSLVQQHRINGTVFRSNGKVSSPPKLTMRAWAIADMDTGKILAEHAFRKHLPEASTLKLLTAVTAARKVPSRPHRVTYAEAHPAFCTCAGLIPGRAYSRHALFVGMLLPSGNDAAEALAGADPHGRKAFIASMNARARSLGATDTHAVNPSGLTANGAHSSARDLLIFLRAAQSSRIVEPYLEMRSGKVGPVDGAKHTVYRGTDYVNDFALAQGKSGFTTPAKNTLVVCTVIDTPAGVRRIGVATLGAPAGHSTEGTRRLTLWAAANYQHLTGLGHLPPAPGRVVGAQAPYVAPGTGG